MPGEIVTRHELLGTLHRAYRPRTYLEIGVEAGRSLALSRTRTIAVDPAFKITSEIRCDLQLVRATSDDFFARADAFAHFHGDPVDLAFVDGLHLFEAALRDLAGCERHSDWTSVLAIDDVLPRSVAEAARERRGRVAWTGDVYKLAEVLGRYRPDLLTLPLDTDPTGILLVLGADPESRILEERYDEIVAEYVRPDPQAVPDAVLRRETALEASSLAGSGVWDELRRAREAGVTREAGWRGIRNAVEAVARPAPLRELVGEEEELRRPEPAPARRGVLSAARRRLRPLRRRLSTRAGRRS